MTLLSWIGIVAAAAVLTYVAAPLWLWTAAAAIALAAYTALGGPPAWLAAGAWLALAVAAVVLNVYPLRRALLSNRLLGWFKRVLPPLSATEREALEAGSVWWEGELFTGRPNWQRVTALAPPALSEREQAFVDGPTETLCGMLDQYDIEHHREDLPEPVWRYMKEQGFFGMIIPREHGGLGLSAQGNSAVVTKIASRSMTAAVTVMVPNSLGPGELLLHYGTDEQRDYYLPRLADGREVPCFALTGPYAGSDAAALPDRAVVCKGQHNGELVLGLRVSWDKRYITLAPVATVLGLAFRVYDPDRLLGDEQNLGVTCALVPTDTPGVEIGDRHRPCGSAFMNGPTRGEDVFIPLDWVIGGRERIGQGWRMLMGCLAAGRAISLPAVGAANGKMASLVTGAYARIRRQFKLPVGQFEGVQEALARIAGETYRMDATRSLTLRAIDAGEHPSVLSAILKYNLTEAQRRVVNDAMDVHGGKGIVEGPNNYLAHAYKSLPISITVEGANILTRSMIIFGQGAIRCHPYLLREMSAAGDADAARGRREFDRALFAHIGLTLSNAVRSLIHGLTGARLARSPVSGPTAVYYRRIARMSAAFSLTADVALLLLGGKLKIKERLSGRFADILSHLYMSAAVLKRFEDDGRPSDDLPHVQWALDDSLALVQERLDSILGNFPSRTWGVLLRAAVFPLGRRYRAPRDATAAAVARSLLADCPTRHRLTAGVYRPQSGEDAVGKLLTAFALMQEAEPVERRLQASLGDAVTPVNYRELLERGLSEGVITRDQADTIRRAHEAADAVIAVDEFPQAEFGTAAPAPEPPAARAS